LESSGTSLDTAAGVTRAWLRLGIAIPATATIAVAQGASPGKPDWFRGRQPLALRLEAPFNDLFAHAQQDGYVVRGTLGWSDGAGQPQQLGRVKIAVRGHTSRRESECPFPKLKVSWAEGTIKIGTHCGEADGDAITPKFGRLPNQLSPVREAFVYHLLDLVGVPTLRARVAEITYVYADATGEQPESRRRHAFVLEDDHEALQRLGADQSIPESRFTTARDAFAPADSATIAFAEALIGNFDWCLRFFKGDAYRCDARHPLWNLFAFQRSDGTARPVMYDFDVSGAVAGYHRWFADIFNEQFLPSKSHAAIEVIAQLQRARTLFDRPVLDATRQKFASNRAAAYRALSESAVDEPGKKAMTDYFDAFFEAMTSDAAFYRPVITAPDVRAYVDSARSQPACASVGALPIGTPVSEPLETRGDMAKVVVVDALWKFAPPAKCSFIHQKPVWIAKSAVGSDYP
jgi:hypothetical protein